MKNSILTPRPSLTAACALALAVVALLVSSNIARGGGNPLGASPIAGKFSDDKVTVELSESAGGFVGTIALGGQQFPAKATATAQGIAGTFTASGKDFDFTATVQNDHLILASGGRSYTLARVVENPLAGNQAAAGPTPPKPDGDAVAGPVESLGAFSVLGTTVSGKTLFMKIAAAPTLEAALTQTADELGKVLDAKPEVSGAFADSKTRSHGGALLSGKLKGKEMHGWIFCGLPKAGAGTACAVIASADAPTAEIQTLFSFMPAQISMKEHAFPDGSGSVDLPPGWTTPDNSLTYGARVIGPGGQLVLMGVSIPVRTPDGNFAQLAAQNHQLAMGLYQNAMRNYQESLVRHRQFPSIPAMEEPKKPDDMDLAKAYPGTIFCRVCSGPEEVLKYFFPISEQMSRTAGGPYSTLDKIIEVIGADSNALIANAKAGIAYLAVTDHNGDKVTPMRVMTRIDTYPILNGKDLWIVSFNTVRAPDATFDRDLPLMNRIMSSFKLNMDVVTKKMAADGDAVRKMGEDNERQLLKRGREFNEAQAEHFAHFEAQMRAQSQARHDANSDFIEYIGGVRTIYDTRTGQTAQVDLFNANAIVDSLNAENNSPDRIIQIPLRYQR